MAIGSDRIRCGGRVRRKPAQARSDMLVSTAARVLGGTSLCRPLGVSVTRGPDDAGKHRGLTTRERPGPRGETPEEFTVIRSGPWTPRADDSCLAGYHAPPPHPAGYLALDASLGSGRHCSPGRSGERIGGGPDRHTASAARRHEPRRRHGTGEALTDAAMAQVRR